MGIMGMIRECFFFDSFLFRDLPETLMIMVDLLTAW